MLYMKIFTIIIILTFYIEAQSLVASISSIQKGIKTVIINLDINGNVDLLENLMVEQSDNSGPFEQAVYSLAFENQKIIMNIINLQPSTKYIFKISGTNMNSLITPEVQTSKIIINQTFELISPRETKIIVRYTHTSEIKSEVIICTYTATGDIVLNLLSNLCSNYTASHNNFNIFNVIASSSFATETSNIQVRPMEYEYEGNAVKALAFEAEINVKNNEGFNLSCNVLYLRNINMNRTVKAFCDPDYCLKTCLNNNFVLKRLNDFTNYVVQIRSPYKRVPIEIAFKTAKYSLEFNIISQELNSFTFNYKKQVQSEPFSNCIIRIYKKEVLLRTYSQNCKDELIVNNLPRYTLFNIETKASMSALNMVNQIETFTEKTKFDYFLTTEKIISFKLAEEVLSNYPIIYKSYILNYTLKSSNTLNQIVAEHTISDALNGTHILIPSRISDPFVFKFCVQRSDTQCKITENNFCGNCSTNILSLTTNPSFNVKIRSSVISDPINGNLIITIKSLETFNPSVLRCYIVVGNLKLSAILDEFYYYDPHTFIEITLSDISFTTQAEFFLNDCLNEINFTLGNNQKYGSIVNKPKFIGLHYTFLFIMCESLSCKSQKTKIYSSELYLAIILIIFFITLLLFIICFIFSLYYQIYFIKNKISNGKICSLIEKDNQNEYIQKMEELRSKMNNNKRSYILPNIEEEQQQILRQIHSLPDNILIHNFLRSEMIKSEDSCIFVNDNSSYLQSSQTQSVHDDKMILNFTNIDNKVLIQAARFSYVIPNQISDKNTESFKMKRRYSIETINIEYMENDIEKKYFNK